MPTRRSLLAAAPLLAAPQLLRAATPRAPLVGKIALDNNRLFTSAWINGEQFLFIIDTGTVQNKIRPEIAERLKLQTTGGSEVRGIGKKSALVGIHNARNVVIGGMVRQPLMTFQSYDFGRGLRQDAAGLLAAGLLTRYATTLDFAKGEWLLYLDGLPPLDGYRPLPARIERQDRPNSGQIYVEATFEGAAIKLLVDTGAPRNLLLYPETGARLNLFDPARPYKEVPLLGFGGASGHPGRQMRAGALQVGAYRFEDLPYVAMDPREPSKGGGADGVLGMNLLGLFDLAIDPGKQKFLVRRNTLPFNNGT